MINVNTGKKIKVRFDSIIFYSVYMWENFVNSGLMIC